MAYQCAQCRLWGCRQRDLTKTMAECPCKDEALQETAKALYLKEENLKVVQTAARVEAEGYGNWCRLEEIIVFAKRMGYQKLGLIFCNGLREEAREVDKILRHHGFEVASATCKNGMIPKSHIGLSAQETLSGCELETMCNPIGQALLMNQEKTQFNILLGLCVGHDTMAIKYLDAPMTVLAVKDRVTGHNPLAPVYMANGYYKKRLYEEK